MCQLFTLAISPSKVMSFWTTLISDVVVNQIWAHKGTCSSESVLLDIPAPQRREPAEAEAKSLYINTFVSLIACTSLPCMFSLTLHLNLRHFECLSADFISPLLLFSEASLWGFHWPPHVYLYYFACLFADALLLFHEAALWQSTTASTDNKFGRSWGEF